MKVKGLSETTIVGGKIKSNLSYKDKSLMIKEKFYLNLDKENILKENHLVNHLKELNYWMISEIQEKELLIEQKNHYKQKIPKSILKLLNYKQIMKFLRRIIKNYKLN